MCTCLRDKQHLMQTEHWKICTQKQIGQNRSSKRGKKKYVHKVCARAHTHTLTHSRNVLGNKQCSPSSMSNGTLATSCTQGTQDSKVSFSLKRWRIITGYVITTKYKNTCLLNIWPCCILLFGVYLVIERRKGGKKTCYFKSSFNWDYRGK